MAYSSSVKKWRDNLSPVGSPVGEEDEDSEEENISSAVQWVTELRPEGGSCLLHAMKVSLVQLEGKFSFQLPTNSFLCVIDIIGV